MKRTFLAASLVLLAAPAFAGSVRGEYVEARTAEVFAGGCVMSSQAETMGKSAVLAWHVTQGVYDGQKLDEFVRSAAKRPRTSARSSTSTSAPHPPSVGRS
jgi:hypothetical protein